MTTERHLRGWLLLGGMLTIAVAFSGCERAAAPTAQGAAPAAGALPVDLWLATEPAEAVSVRAVKLDAAAGREVAVRGRIGGRKDPFVTGSAVFLLVDKALPTCNEKYEDGCPTPWDYCCEAREDVLASSATVQVVGGDGRPLKVGLQGQHGLVPGAEVVVKGQVAAAEKDGTLVLTARGVYVATK
ncbi:MAG: hypothetical protein AB1601_16435 [Planctomycetota bacterium]